MIWTDPRPIWWHCLNTDPLGANCPKPCESGFLAIYCRVAADVGATANISVGFTNVERTNFRFNPALARVVHRISP